MNKFINLRLIGILLFAVIISACGGGGGDSGNNAPQSEPAVWENTSWDNMTWQ